MKNRELFSNVASILSQDGIDAVYSGAAATSEKKEKLIIEGVEGFGDQFMIGKDKPIELPMYLKEKILETHDYLYNNLGPITFEWVYDGENVWIVQLSKSESLSMSKVICDGKADTFISFPVSNGLEALREKIKSLSPNTGIKLIGNIGITSHFGDILRKANIPSYLESAE